MKEKSTTELEEVLNNTHVKNFSQFCKENKDSVTDDDKAFIEYFKTLFKEKGVSQQTVFLRADIPERYGYKLLSGEKRTRQRDVILRICYAANFTVDETQRALKKYGMQPLYAKVTRDALLLVLFKDRPGSILDVNTILSSRGMPPLRTSGVQE